MREPGTKRRGRAAPGHAGSGISAAASLASASAVRGAHAPSTYALAAARAPASRATPSMAPPPARLAAPLAAQRPAGTRAAPGAAVAQQEAEEAAGWRVVGPRGARRKAAPGSRVGPGTAAVAPPARITVATPPLQDDQCLPGGGEAAQEDEAQLCDTCCEAPANAVMVPCGHRGLQCWACAERWRKVAATKPGGPTCPLCRALLREVKRAF
ncbi:hypothetical protein Rsub_05345 [Raphidocelis subcapitata]|uniref:RING-type domain-containing protein n=1 Tax=Raphidocelis subcapitata TaxID=307507 RepID=A0A2V0P012_9CHLO|nr:hypothetical protein Rsub_05345 [Raphidocelis subcapitata]|eukprot:GBF92262.1 hypothetical protein Rsub_05345 [Raphidocelis subcapitata]